MSVPCFVSAKTSGSPPARPGLDRRAGREQLLVIRIRLRGATMLKRRRLSFVLASAGTVLLVLTAIGSASARPSPSTSPKLVTDVKTGSDKLGSLTPAVPDPIQDYVQPDTEIEPSIAVNPTDPKNVVAVYQEGRIADGGDATNGFATSVDSGKTWKTGELPGLTN